MQATLDLSALEAESDESAAAELATLEQAMYDRAHVDPKEFSRWLDASI